MHDVKVFFTCIVAAVIGAVGGLILGVVIAVVYAIWVLINGADFDGYGQAADAIFILCLVGGTFVGFFVSIMAEVGREQQEQKEKQDRCNQAQAAQRALALQLSTLMSDSSATAKSLPGLISIAEATLDRAEEEFRDGAFAPFWDAVEEAANTLARFTAAVQGLVRNATDYRSNSSRLPAPLPPFQLGVQTLPDATQTAERMRRIVRKAQKDFKFATIFEQRKTNQLLVAGFSSLGQAINELGDQIDSSLEALGFCIETAVADASSVAAKNIADAASQIESLRGQIAIDSDERRKHDKVVREKLDSSVRLAEELKWELKWKRHCEGRD